MIEDYRRESIIQSTITVESSLLIFNRIIFRCTLLKGADSREFESYGGARMGIFSRKRALKLADDSNIRN